MLASNSENLTTGSNNLSKLKNIVAVSSLCCFIFTVGAWHRDIPFVLNNIPFALELCWSHIKLISAFCFPYIPFAVPALAAIGCVAFIALNIYEKFNKKHESTKLIINDTIPTSSVTSPTHNSPLNNILPPPPPPLPNLPIFDNKQPTLKEQIEKNKKNNNQISKKSTHNLTNAQGDIVLEIKKKIVSGGIPKERNDIEKQVEENKRKSNEEREKEHPKTPRGQLNAEIHNNTLLQKIKDKNDNADSSNSNTATINNNDITPPSSSIQSSNSTPPPPPPPLLGNS